MVVAIETSVGVEEEDGEKHILIYGPLELGVLAGRDGKSKWRESFDVRV